MNQVKANIGVQSWSFRAFKTLDQLIEQLKAVGANTTELCGVHADFNDESTFSAVISKFSQAGIRIVSIGIQGFSGNAAVEEKWFKFVKQAGASRIGVSFGPDNHLQTIKVIETLADKYDVYAGIHNHGGYDWLGSRTALAYIFRNSSKRLGLELDAAWAMQAGEDPIKMAEQFIDRLYGVHVKDFTFDRAGRVSDQVVGTGNLDLPRLIDIVKNKAPDGCNAIIEYEADEANPGPAIAACVKAINAVG